MITAEKLRNMVLDEDIYYLLALLSVSDDMVRTHSKGEFQVRHRLCIPLNEERLTELVDHFRNLGYQVQLVTEFQCNKESYYLDINWSK